MRGARAAASSAASGSKRKGAPQDGTPAPAAAATAAPAKAARRKTAPVAAAAAAPAKFKKPQAPVAPTLFFAPAEDATPAESLTAIPPAFVAPDGEGGGLWRERYASACAACFAARLPCPHFAERPLRLLLIGHNPSTHAWTSGYPYSNPTNRFWKLMSAARLVPDIFKAADADAAPSLLGMGITDLGCEPGSDASEYKRAIMLAWRENLYARLGQHLARCSAWTGISPAMCAPALVAFTGKRQWASLFQPPLSGFEHGVQVARPPGWPLPACTEVWVLPSSSGRAVMTKEAREAPYVALGLRVAELPWPRET